MTRSVQLQYNFFKPGELNGSKYVKIPLRSNAILNNEKNDKYCFVWSKLSYLHPCKNYLPNRVANYKQYFNELNIDGFDFINGINNNDVHKLYELKILSINLPELGF